jgi:hypothetical protein
MKEIIMKCLEKLEQKRLDSESLLKKMEKLWAKVKGNFEEE